MEFKVGRVGRWDVKILEREKEAALDFMVLCLENSRSGGSP